MPQDPPRQLTCGTMMVMDRAPFWMELKRRPLSKVIGRPFDSLKPVYVCRTYYVAHTLGTYLQSLLKRGRSADNRLRHIWRISRMTVKVLYDSGGSKSMIKKTISAKGIRLAQNNSRMLMNTLAGTYAPRGSVEIKGMRLPAFDKNRILAEHDFIVFDQ